jgi:diguanylate cyclase (GGDEF)-like protein
MLRYPIPISTTAQNSNIEVKCLVITFVIIFLINTPVRYLKSERLSSIAFELGLTKNAIDLRNQTITNILQLNTHELIQHYFENPNPLNELQSKLLHQNNFITKLEVRPVPRGQPGCDTTHQSSIKMQSLYKPEKQRLVAYQPICNNLTLIGYLYLEVNLRNFTYFPRNKMLMVSKNGLIYVSTNDSLPAGADINSKYPKLWRELEMTNKTEGTLEYPDITIIYQRLTLFNEEPIYIIKTLEDGDLIPFYFYVIIVLLGATVGISLYLRQLRKEKRILKQISFTDQLSGLHNRHYLMHIAKKVENDGHYYVCIFDIDHFKKINDCYGHDIGDQVIKRVASVIKSRIRITDYTFRIGGEEFLILIKTDNKEYAINIAERIRHDIETMAQKPNITISGGICCLSASLNETIKCADELLYSAKEGGRNTISCQPL